VTNGLRLRRRLCVMLAVAVALVVLAPGTAHAQVTQISGTVFQSSQWKTYPTLFSTNVVSVSFDPSSLSALICNVEGDFCYLQGRMIKTTGVQWPGSQICTWSHSHHVCSMMGGVPVGLLFRFSARGWQGGPDISYAGGLSY